MNSCYKNTLSEALYQYMREDYLCDVTIVVSGGVSLSAHSVVLATVSNKLRAAFERTHTGGPHRRPNWGYRLAIEECNLESVQAILQFVYTGSIHLFHNMETDLNAKDKSSSPSNRGNLCREENKDFQVQVLKNAGIQNALGILHAGQKLGLDPVKLESCLRVMMENGPLNIEDTTQYILTDEDVILDVVDKDPNTRSSLNLVETMRVTSQALPIVCKEHADDNYFGVDILDTKANGKKFISNVSLVVDLGEQSKFLSECNVSFNSTGAVKSNSKDCLALDVDALKSSLALMEYKKIFSNGQDCRNIMQSRGNSEEIVLLKTASIKHCRNSSFAEVYSTTKLPFIVNSVFNHTISTPCLEVQDSMMAHQSDVSSIAEDSSYLEKVNGKLIDNTNPRPASMSDVNITEKKINCHQPEKNETRENNNVVSEGNKYLKRPCSDGTSKPIKTLQDGSKPYRCDICGRSFARRYTAIEHKRLHSGEKPYQCDRCGKRFTTCGDLTKHRRSQHGAIKPHVCSICGKEMSTGREVADHKRLHEGGNRCPVCHKTFTRLHNMKEHLRGTHQGYRLFSCPYCDKKFVYSGSLRFHKKQHRLNNHEIEQKSSPSKGTSSIGTSGECLGRKLSGYSSTELSHLDLYRNDKNLRFLRCRDDFNGEFKSTSLTSHHDQSFSENVSGCEQSAKYKCDKTSGTDASLDSSQIGGMLRSSSIPDRAEINSMDVLQDQVLVDFSLSGMISFGTGD